MNKVAFFLFKSWYAPNVYKQSSTFAMFKWYNWIKFLSSDERKKNQKEIKKDQKKQKRSTLCSGGWPNSNG